MLGIFASRFYEWLYFLYFILEIDISDFFIKFTWNLIPRSLKSVLSHDNFHLVFIVAELNFSFPIQTTCVLSKFTFKPEIIEKSCNTFNISLSEFSDPSKMTDISSAYCDSLYSLLFMKMLFMVLLLLIINATISAHKTNIFFWNRIHLSTSSPNVKCKKMQINFLLY